MMSVYIQGGRQFSAVLLVVSFVAEHSRAHPNSALPYTYLHVFHELCEHDVIHRHGYNVWILEDDGRERDRGSLLVVVDDVKEHNM